MLSVWQHPHVAFVFKNPAKWVANFTCQLNKRRRAQGEDEDGTWFTSLEGQNAEFAWAYCGNTEQILKAKDCTVWQTHLAGDLVCRQPSSLLFYRITKRLQNHVVYFLFASSSPGTDSNPRGTAKAALLHQHIITVYLCVSNIIVSDSIWCLRFASVTSQESVKNCWTMGAGNDLLGALGLKGVPYFKNERDDDGIDRLSHRWTVALFILFASFALLKQIVGSPVSCWTPKHFSKDSQEPYTDKWDQDQSNIVFCM